jgi:hypothetical protein
LFDTAQSPDSPGARPKRVEQAVRLGGRAPGRICRKKFGRLRLGPSTGLSAELLGQRRGTLAGMSRAPRITRVAVHRFTWQTPDLGVDYNGFNQVYQAGNCLDQTGYVLAIGTDLGITGEYVGGTA